MHATVGVSVDATPDHDHIHARLRRQILVEAWPGLLKML